MSAITTDSAEAPVREAPAPAAALRPRGERWLMGLTAIVALLVAAPILGVAASVLAGPGETLAHLAATVLGEVLRDTSLMLVLVGLGTASIGVITAWLVTMCRFPGAGVFAWALLLPLAMPAYIIGYAYTDFLAFAGPVQTGLRDLFGWSRQDYWFPDIHGVAGVSLMLTLVLYPYVYILARTAFLDQSVCALEASRMLGSGPWGAFFRVALPLARPAIAAGVALALMEALADFGTVQYFGVTTFTTVIYRTWFGMGDRVAAAQLSTALLAFVLMLIALEAWSRRRQRFHHTTKRHRVNEPLRLGGTAALLAFCACLAPIVAGFVLPVAILIGLHAEGGDPFFGERFLFYARNSLVLAGGTAVLVVAVALLLAYTVRTVKHPGARVLVRVASIGYAVPGTVIAVGVLVPLGLFDNAVDRFMRDTFGVSTGLLLSGTVAAMVFAYLVRFLAVASGALDSGFGKVSTHLDECARTLGSGVAGVVGRIHLPLLRRSMLAAGVVVFVDVLKELPATLIVRPFNFDTLAVRVYQLASDERLAQASTGALVIVAIGLLPVIVLTRMIGVRRKQGRAATADPAAS